jgi:hypothetical protein
MSPPKNLNKLYLFLFCGLMAACTAETGPSAAVYPEAGTPDEILFNGRCDECHKPPLPQDRAAGAWPMIVERMQRYRIANGLTPLTGEEEQRIKAYLQRNAKRPS